MSTMTRPVPPEALRVMSAPFFANGETSAFVVLCCDRVFVGSAPAALCGHCKGTPQNVEVTSPEQASQLGTL